MRLLKKWDRINTNPLTDKVEPFRSFKLTVDEIEKLRELPVDSNGIIISSNISENFLKEILISRQMESLLYPELEKDDWSGYCKLWPDGTFWML
jgi:hypothetical protein